MGLAGNVLAPRPRASSAGGGAAGGGRRAAHANAHAGAALLPSTTVQQNGGAAHNAHHPREQHYSAGSIGSLLLHRGSAIRAGGAALIVFALLSAAVLRGGGLLLGGGAGRAADEQRPWLLMLGPGGGEEEEGRRSSGGAPAAAAAASSGRAAYVARERLHRAIAEECARGEDTVIRLDGDGGGGGGGVLVEQAVDYSHCPLMDIMLRGSERGIGMCTDAALYVAALGARLLPAGAAGARYDAACGARTARLFLETMYGEFVAAASGAAAPGAAVAAGAAAAGGSGSGGASSGAAATSGGAGGRLGVLHLQLVNNEHLWAADDALHAKMGAFLCKTRFCAGLMRAHVAARGWPAEVRYMGHASLDPGVDAPADATRRGGAGSGGGGRKAAQAQAPPFLHVKGKSGLKHTRELLECWAKRPELPLLHVVGRFAWAEVEAAASVPNIKFYPRVTRDAAGPDRQTEHVSFGDVRRLQLEMPVHICTSEREGFGHYINEARAAAAAVLSTDHPPMNELVPPESGGLLVAPARTGSYAEQVLGRYAPLNAYLAPDAICEGAAALAKLSPRELRRRGRAARVAYLRDRAAFLAAAAELRAFLEARRARVIEEERGGGSLGNSSSSLGIGSSINSNSSSNWGSKDSAAVLYVQQQQREQQEEERQKKLKQQS